jgi:hypothetical protein
VIGRGRRATTQRRRRIAGGATAAVIAIAAAGGLLARFSGSDHAVRPSETSVSTIASSVHVPAIVGLTQVEAEHVLASLELVAAATLDKTDCAHAEVVTRQDPSAGAEVPTGSTVRIDVGANATLQVNCASAADQTLADDFEAFAADPSRGGPFASSVALGLGNQFRTMIDTSDLTDPARWRLDLTGYAEASGTLSVLDLVATHADNSEVTTDVSPSFCPSTLVDRPEPQLTRGGAPVRIRATGTTACMELWTVDLYRDDDGRIVGVNVSLGAP